MINSYIGIRQELKAKATLDELAVLVAPQARVVRDGAAVELLAEEVVPGDVVAVEPGDQLVADGEVIAQPRDDPRRVDADRRGRRGPQGPRRPGRSPAPSASRGSGHYVVDAVREESYAGRLAGEAQRLPPPALAAAGRGQPGDRRLHLRDGAAGGRC